MKKIILNEDLLKIIISLLIFIVSYFFKDIQFWFLVVSYIIVSYEVIIEAIKKVCCLKFFDETMLMVIATISAFLIGEYPEAVMVMLLFEFGEYLSDLAVSNSKKSITKLMDLRSDYANVIIKDKVVKTDIKKIKLGDEFIVKPGEKIPLDGDIIHGESTVDTSSLTGESILRKVGVNDKVLSGFVNSSSVIKVKATSVYNTSTASKIINMIEKSNDKKSKTEKFITRFSNVYTPIVVLLAILITLIPSMLGYDFNTWVYRSLVFLVTSCPCALVISVPLGFFCGIGKSSKEGILIKGSSELESLNKIDTMVFDKTGTITKGNFEITNVHSVLGNDDELLKLAAYGEYYSNHPIADKIKSKYESDIDVSKISDFKEVSGLGVMTNIDGDKVLIGNEKLMNKYNISCDKVSVGTIVYVSKNNEYLGYLTISDKIKEEAYGLISNLNKLGVENVILSGDDESIVKEVAEALKVNKYYANLLPGDKVLRLEEIKKDGFTAFVGDGINDAPVIKISDIGISMGGIGSDAAIEASDVVLMHDDLSKIPIAIKISKITKSIVNFNILFALGFKVLMLVLAALGFASIWMAVFADVGVTLIAVLNSIRIMKMKIK